MKRSGIFIMLAILLSISLCIGAPAGSQQNRNNEKKQKRVTPADRKSAAKRAAALGLKPGMALLEVAMPDPGGTPHYFGPYANWAYSPLPSGGIETITVVEGGSGYSDTPSVSILDAYGTGSGAAATATVSGGVITGITIDNAGAGYTAPIVTITDATGQDAAASTAIGGVLSGGIRKFVDFLPRLCGTPGAVTGECIPIAVPDACTYSGETADCYEIELREYSAQLHSDLPLTRLRGYVQVRNGVDVAPIYYLGPVIVSDRDKPVRIKFTNKLPTNAGGDLFIPVDTTVMGAGMGPLGMDAMPMNYSQNRGTLHLHGGFVPWISDGTPHQWTTPAGENTSYPRGVSVYNVPDMPNGGSNPPQGTLTFYYNNQQSARLMFYHDHSYGITRLNVYAGEAAGYLITDQVEKDLIDGTNITGVNPPSARLLPDLGVPLIIQDKSFVDANTIAGQDPTWNWGTTPGVPNTGDLWYPHVYMSNQNPEDQNGINSFGRWHYGPWFWPPTTDVVHGPAPNPYYDCGPGGPCASPWEPPLIPGVPHVSMAMEAFMDTPVVNGKAYPYIEVDPKAYRFRVLNAADDRFFNLQLYVAADKNSINNPTPLLCDGSTAVPQADCTEIKMVPAAATAGFPPNWPKDGREGGVPDPATAGPAIVQIGTEGGFLPAPVVLRNQPVTWNLDQTNFDFGVVKDHTLLLGPAERADVIIDFSAYAGKTLILYNDSPAPFPALDPRYDYYTGAPDLTDVGGTPGTKPGYGPNTRTIMQIRVAAGAAVPYNIAALREAFAKTASKRGVFEVSQDEIIIPQAAYNTAYNKAFPADTFVRIHETSKTFTTVSGTTVTAPFEPKAIQDEMGEAFETEFGRMNGFLGLEVPGTGAGNQNFILYPFTSPPVEIVKSAGIYGAPIGGFPDGTQIWKITHNGVDTHTIHTHLFNAQLINRVAWDNAIRPPDANELGWKETFRVNPLQDTIIAFRAITPTQPFDVPNSVRPIDPTMPLGAVLPGGPLGFMDPTGQPVSVINHLVNYGWEYVYHCHLLAHEEMDMMHTVAFALPPKAPSNLAANVVSGSIVLSWNDNSLNETEFTVQKSTDSAFTTFDAFRVNADVTTYNDSAVTANQSYYYRVFATNRVGDTQNYQAPSQGFPNVTLDSALSNTILVAVTVPPQDIVIDNVDPNTSRTGTWWASGAPNPFGADSVWSRNATTFSWHFTAPKTGSYSVSMWWTEWSSRSNNIPVDIQHAGGTTRVFINQLTNGGKWNILGTYSFEAGKTYRVIITSRPGPSSTCADAVKFTQVATVPEIIVDNTDTRTSKTGTWWASGAPNPYGADSVWSRNGATFSWSFTALKTGNYDVSMWWTEWPSRGANVPLDIQHAGGTTRVFINQLANGGKWNLLGTFPFQQGSDYRVTITSQNNPLSTCADAVKFTEK